MHRHRWVFDRGEVQVKNRREYKRSDTADWARPDYVTWTELLYDIVHCSVCGKQKRRYVGARYFDRG